MKSFYAFALCCVFTFVLSATAISAQMYFPPVLGSTWETTKPEDLGWNTNKINDLYTFLEGENTKGFIVLKDGKIVLEKYFGTFTADSAWYWASAGKSLTATLIGKAQESGILSISDITSKYLGKGWTVCPPDKEDKITIRHQLTMSSGLNDSSGDKDCTIDTCLKYLADAGTRWAYHNAPYTLLESVIEKASGISINQYTRQNIFTSTGMTGLWTKVDFNNVFVSKPRSMARFGLLALNKFVWDKTPILTDSTYIAQMTSTSQNYNTSYGYLWWLNGKSSYMLPGFQVQIPGSLAPDAPIDMYTALGKDGQICSISPSKRLVVVRMGNRPNSPSSEIATQLCNQIWQYLNQIMTPYTNVEEDAVESSVLLAPNPSSTKHITYLGKPLFIEIRSLVGEVMWRGFAESGTDISLEHCARGVYFLRTESACTKFILE